MKLDELVDELVAAVSHFPSIGPDPAKWPKWNGGWARADVALVDAVLSTRQPYSRTLATVEEWRIATEDIGDRELAIFTELLNEELAQILTERKLPGTRTLRRDGIIELAQILMTGPFNCRTGNEIRSRIKTKGDALEVRHAMESVKGVGPATSSYFLMLIGVDGVKADSIVSRFVSDAVKEHLSQGEIERIVGAAAERFGSTRQALDYAIWDKAPRIGHNR